MSAGTEYRVQSDGTSLRLQCAMSLFLCPTEDKRALSNSTAPATDHHRHDAQQRSPRKLADGGNLSCRAVNGHFRGDPWLVKHTVGELCCVVLIDVDDLEMRGRQRKSQMRVVGGVGIVAL